MRRTKEEFLKDLPPKYDLVVWVKINEKQIHLYENFLNSDEVKELLSNHNDGKARSPLIQLLVLKKICDHPRRLTTNNFEKLIYDQNINLDKLNTVDNVPVDLLLKESSKLCVLNKLLDILIKEKHKILIFSSSTKMLDIIEKVLKLNKIIFTRLDGQISSNSKREKIIDSFNKDLNIQVMILTVQGNNNHILILL